MARFTLSLLRRNLFARRICSCLWLTCTAAFAPAEPLPGDVFREVIWTAGGKWQRITGPDATHPGALEQLPNATNSVTLPDLTGATRLEVQLELLQCHAGTIGHAIRINQHEWVPLPVPDNIPGDAGSTADSPDRWQTMLYPTVDLPLAMVHAGENSFEFTTKPGTGLGATWPQSIVYGSIFRLYYDDPSAPRGTVVAPTGKLNRFGALTLQANPVPSPGRSMRRIDFLARYEGYDWRGSSHYIDWHHHSHFGQLRRHPGSAFLAPWTIDWNVHEVPQQTEPIQIAARLEDDTGLIRITDAVTLTPFQGSPDTIMITPRNVPPKWNSRAGKRLGCTLTLPDDLTGVAEAWLVLASWNGAGSDSIDFNQNTLVRNVGFNHDLSYDTLSVPISMLRPGENVVETFSETKHHGIEVLWPGPVLFLRFTPPEAAH